MRTTGVLLFFQLLCFCHLYAQKPKPDSLPKLSGKSAPNTLNTDSKIQLQQFLLLGRQQQLELNRQEQQKILRGLCSKGCWRKGLE